MVQPYITSKHRNPSDLLICTLRMDHGWMMRARVQTMEWLRDYTNTRNESLKGRFHIGLALNKTSNNYFVGFLLLFCDVIIFRATR